MIITGKIVDPSYIGPTLEGFYYKSEHHYEHYLLRIEKFTPETWVDAKLYTTQIPQKDNGHGSTNEVELTNGELISITTEDSDEIATLSVGYKYYCIESALQLYYGDEDRKQDVLNELTGYNEVMRFAVQKCLEIANIKPI